MKGGYDGSKVSYLVAGDGLALQDCDQVRVDALRVTALLLFDIG